ncbi:Polyketide cyclase / dehydrase and lipid transport [Gemmobacter aquatilis]|uniref:Polyketide cyclase / dehydrase and lipid transport n=1 Tax=Gemmobacter aquatilis TaxID=933059 RepID=A0A1H8I9K0_9RHOB|nr:SRPBCC family protein [Gemmobacter aquatilis]SEN64972.1 Polyketide cyclase / dehydrase and lipid transport [Gemmobacter aquatilis]
MKLSTREDIEAPLATVFQAFADTDAWERAVLRRGAEVTRVDRLSTPGPGMAWVVGFDYRGKPRRVTVKLSQIEAPNILAFTYSTSAFEGSFSLDFVELSARRTRVSFATEVKPRTLASRLLLQSMKLAKGKVERKFETRIAQICHEIEERHRAAPRR